MDRERGGAMDGGEMDRETAQSTERSRVGGQEPASGDVSDSGQTSGSRVTRREFLAGAAVATAAVAVAGCSPFGQSTGPFALSRAAQVFFDGTVPAALQPAILKQLANVHGIPSATSASSSASADLVLTYGAVPSGYVGALVGTSPLALFTHMRVPVDAITHDQAVGLLSGQVSDWKAVGAPASLGVHLFALGNLALPQGVTVASGAKSVSSIPDLVSALIGQAGSIAVLPADGAAWQVRNLGVDGVYAGIGRGDSSKGGLPGVTLSVGVSSALSKQGLDAKTVAAALASALSAATILDVVAVGDIMLGRGVNSKMVAYHDYTYPYKAVHDELQSADYRIANLECTITDLIAPPSDPTTFTFISSKKAVDGLTYAGFNAVTVANNHAAGPGKAAMLDMLATLRANNIVVTGGGSDITEATTPAVATAKGTRIALLGYLDSADGENGKPASYINPNVAEVSAADLNISYGIPSQGASAAQDKWGYAKLEVSTLAQDIAAAHQKADLVIPYFHWGHEFEGDRYPNGQYRYPYKVWKRQADIAHMAIDAGADMVLGNHPHVTQGIEEYKGKLIVYSMGNFVFDQWWSEQTKEGVMLHLYWRGTTLVGLRIIPTYIRDLSQPTIMSVSDAVGVMGRLWQSTDDIASAQYDGNVWWLPVP